MDFEHGPDRQMLVDMFGRFLSERYGFDERQRIAGSADGFSRPLWRQMADLGILAALFEDKDGGLGGDPFDIFVLFEAAGAALMVEPLLGTLLAGRALAAAGGRQDLLADLIAGTTIAAFAHYEPQGRYDPRDIATRARRDGDGWRLSGTKAVVPHAGTADLFILSAGTAEGDGDALSLFAVSRATPGLSVRDYPMVDGGRGGEILLDDMLLPGDALLGAEGTALPIVETVLAAGLLALSSEAVGVMEILKRDTLDYLKTRTQFGAPIGKFQVLQHRMATLLIEIEQARSAVINAAAALGGDPRTRDRAGSAAKYTVGRAGTLVAEEAIQMHGGIGMTWEMPLAHYAKRAIMIDHQLGDEDHHLARYIALRGEAVIAAT
jgi:alkylation response protein AidB-like acyl-CoA dehydrogenase